MATLEGVIAGSATGDPVTVRFPPVLLDGPICGPNGSEPSKFIVT